MSGYSLSGDKELDEALQNIAVVGGEEFGDSVFIIHRDRL